MHEIKSWHETSSPGSPCLHSSVWSSKLAETFDFPQDDLYLAPLGVKELLYQLSVFSYRCI